MTWVNDVEMLERKEGLFKCKVREANKITTGQPTINRDQGSNLAAIYSESLPLPRERDRQTGDHSPMSSGQLA